MNVPVTSLFKPPYGLAFTVPDLLRVRHWCEKRGLCMDVALDQTMDDVEFEELLIITPPSREKTQFYDVAHTEQHLRSDPYRRPTGLPHRGRSPGVAAPRPAQTPRPAPLSPAGALRAAGIKPPRSPSPPPRCSRPSIHPRPQQGDAPRHSAPPTSPTGCRAGSPA